MNWKSLNELSHSLLASGRMTHRLSPRFFALVCGLLLLVAACSHGTRKISESRYIKPDTLYQINAENVRRNPEFEVITDIDHSRLAAKAGSSMPPSHVLIWSDPALEAAILKQNPVAGMDLPLRVLAFDDPGTGSARVIANSYDYLARRFALPATRSPQW